MKSAEGLTYAKGEDYRLSVHGKGYHSGPCLILSAIPSIQEVLTMVGRSFVPGKVIRYGVGEHKDRGHNQEHVPFDNDNLYEVFVVNY